jgi:hypothetical protein
MRMRLGTKRVEFVYNDSRIGAITTIDVVKEFENHGGAISPNTEIEFREYFPGSAYKKTALTNNMPDSYLCMGSMSALFFDGTNRLGGVALSLYKDLSGHDPEFGDHKNIYLQWETPDSINHSNEIPNRHIKLGDSLTIRSLFDNIEQFKISI